MENIVHNFAKISFQPKEVVLTENRSAAPVFSTAATPHQFEWNLKPMARHATSQSDDMLESESADTDQSDEVDSQLHGGDDDNDASDSSNCSSSYAAGGGGHHRGGVISSLRRRNPARASKDNFNRVCSTIMKSSSREKRRDLHTNKQTLKSIEKIYTSKRMKKFTPANLETIFEEPSDENAADAEDDSEECGAISSQVRLVKFGSRKLRRSISFNDGLNKNKSLIKKRRLKVKKTFGKRFALKKISMTEFHDRLNKSLDSAMFDGDDEPPSTGIAAANVDRATDIGFMDDMQLPPLLAHQSFE